MADVRIQDFNENQNPSSNDDYLMTFNANSESKTKLRDAFYSLVPDGAPTHANIFRGKNLGALNATHISNIQNGTFKDMFIGDYFSINGSNYVIAGINWKHGHGDTQGLQNHLVLMPDRFSKMEDGTELRPNGSDTHFMNDTDTTAGGFVNTKLYKAILPSVQKKLEADFGSHLLSFRTLLSTKIDENGAPSSSEWLDAKVSIPNEIMVYGSTINGNNKNGSSDNIGDDNTQLPLFRLNPDEVNNHRDNAFWLRDIHSAIGFAIADFRGTSSWSGASHPWAGVRAFFLVG